jgi:hypothetical protein
MLTDRNPARRSAIEVMSATFARYKSALLRIANGEQDAMIIAREALRSRKAVAQPKLFNPNYRTAEQIAEASYLRAKEIFELWCDQEKPKLSMFAKTIGMSPKRTGVWVRHGVRIYLHPRWKTHPLHKHAAKYDAK